MDDRENRENEDRFTAIEKRLTGVENTITDISSDTKALLELFTNAKIGMRFIVFSGSLISWFAKTAITVFSILTIWYAVKTGKIPPTSINIGGD